MTENVKTLTPPPPLLPILRTSKRLPQFRDDKRCVEDLMDAAKFVVTPETKQLEFEAALLAYEDDMCAEFERKQEEAATALATKESGGGDDSKAKANGKAGKDDDDGDTANGDGRKRGRSRSGGRRSKSRSRSKSDSRSRSRSRSRTRGSRKGRDRDHKKEKAEKKVVPEVAPTRGFQEILDKRAVNLGIVFDALVEKAVVKRKEEVSCPAFEKNEGEGGKEWVS